MRIFTLLPALALACVATAQISNGGVPYGLRAGLSMAEVPTLRSAPFDAAQVAVEDAQRAAQGLVPAYSRVLPLGADLLHNGLWTRLPNGDRLWRLRIASDGALATELFFTGFELPDNASLFVYSEDGRFVLGGFSAFNNRDDRTFTTSLIPGEASVLEYYEPAAVEGMGSITVASVGHAYRDVAEVAASGACEVDVNCSEGANWHPQRDAVVRMSIVSGGASYWCSGTLVNNVAQNCKVYILSADHCAEGTATSEYNYWKFYFNYERTGCGSGTVFSTHSITGCVKRGASNDNGGDSGSDFLLLEASNTSIPSTYHPYWAGWDATGTGSTGGVCIHHPGGDYKKISTYTGTTVNSNWQGPMGTHWAVGWATTTNGRGVTEPGSSGSPLFNSAKRVIGTLTGGSSCCTANGCGPGTSPNGTDYYGKVSYHWQSNPGPASMRLKNFLDPQATGTLVLDGSYDPCGMTAGIATDQPALPTLALRPNPANDAVMVAIPGPAGPGVLEVRDLGGRLVGTQVLGPVAEQRIDTAPLEGGVYLLRWTVNGETRATAPLIVVHP